AGQWQWLALGYGMIGLGVSATLMGSLVALSATVAPHNLPLAIGILMASGGIGQLLTATPLAWLAEAAGWRLAVVCIAGVTGIMAVAVWRTLPARSAGAGTVTFLRAFRDYALVLRRPGFMPI